MLLRTSSTTRAEQCCSGVQGVLPLLAGGPGGCRSDQRYNNSFLAAGYFIFPMPLPRTDSKCTSGGEGKWWRFWLYQKNKQRVKGFLAWRGNHAPTGWLSTVTDRH